MTNHNQNNGFYNPKQLNIPPTATVFYYTPGEVEITPLVQDGAYRSWKAELDEPAYGPVHPGMWEARQDNEERRREEQREREERREKEKEEKIKNNLCVKDGCSDLAIYEGTDLCNYHRRDAKESEWLIKNSADFAASVIIPGYSVAKTVAGAASWIIGKATDSQSASDFGRNALKDELKSESSMLAASKMGINPDFGGYAYSGAMAVNSIVIHQKHVNAGNNYQRGCPVCDY